MWWGSSLVAQQVKDLTLSLLWLEALLWLGFDPWPRNFHVRLKKKKKKITVMGVPYWSSSERMWRFHLYGPGSFPGQGTEIPQQATAWQGVKKKRKNKCVIDKKEQHWGQAHLGYETEVKLLIPANFFGSVCSDGDKEAFLIGLLWNVHEVSDKCYYHYPPWSCFPQRSLTWSLGPSEFFFLLVCRRHLTDTQMHTHTIPMHLLQSLEV